LSPPTSPLLSLHDALPIFVRCDVAAQHVEYRRHRLESIYAHLDADLVQEKDEHAGIGADVENAIAVADRHPVQAVTIIVENIARSEEHTSELQSRFDLVCR